MKLLFSILLSLGLCLSLTCNINHGLEPLRSSIEGQITFSGTWPAEAEEVRLVSAKKFPPTGIADIAIGENLPADVSTYNYKYYLDPGEYKLIGIIWRAKNSTWDILSICSIYFDGTDSLSQGEITLASDTSTVCGINMHVDRNKARKITDTKIQGNIKFNGEWPDDIFAVTIITTTRFSLSPMQLPTLLDIAFSNTISPGVESASYTINAYPGKFAATGAIFFREGQTLSITDILYTIQVNGLSLTSLEIQENQHIQGTEFNIQF